jgi:hypothetical protein
LEKVKNILKIYFSARKTKKRYKYNTRDVVNCSGNYKRAKANKEANMQGQLKGIYITTNKRS